MTSLFDRQATLERMSRRPSLGPPTGFAENTASAFEASRRVDLSVSEDILLSEVFDDYITEIEGETGKRLANPMSELDIFGAEFHDLPVDERARAFRAQRDQRRGRDPEAKVNSFLAEVEKLGVTPRSMEAIREEAFKRARDLAGVNEDVARRAGFMGTLGQFTGAAGAALTDPPIALSLGVGAPAASGILRTALTEAAIGGTVEAAIQPAVQDFRERAGLPSGFGEAFRNVVLAAAGGGVFAGAIKGGLRGGRALLDTVAERQLRAQERAAQAHLARQVEIAEETPFAPARRQADAEHVARTSEAEIDLATGTPRRSSEPISATTREARASHTTADDIAAEGAARDAFEAGQAMRARVIAEFSDTEDLKRAAEIADEIKRLGGLDAALGLVRNPPPAPRVETLTGFLKRQGGLQDFQGELKAIDVINRHRPGIISKTGLTMDEAGLRAFEAGFFPERPDIAEFLRVLDEDFSKRAPRMTADDAQSQAGFESVMRDLGEVERAFDEVGIDARTMTDAEALARLEAVRGAARQAETAPPDAQPMSDGRAAAQAAEEAEAQGESFDDILETELRSEVESGSLDRSQRVFLDEEGGERTVGDLMDEIDEDGKIADEWDNCLKGIPF